MGTRQVNTPGTTTISARILTGMYKRASRPADDIAADVKALIAGIVGKHRRASASYGAKHMSARTPKPYVPRHYIGAYAGRRYDGSVEAKLREAATTAYKSLPAMVSAPVSAAIGGVSGFSRAMSSGVDPTNAAVRGLIGVGEAFIPGRFGFANSVTGIIDSIADDPALRPTR